MESNASRKGLEHGQCTRLCCLLQAEALARRKPRHTWHCMPARLSGASVAATRHNDTTIQHQPAMMPTLVNPASSRASRIAPRNSGQSRCRLGIMKRWQDDVFSLQCMANSPIHHVAGALHATAHASLPKSAVSSSQKEVFGGHSRSQHPLRLET